MARRSSLTSSEKRHRVAVALPHRLDAFDAAPDDSRWSPLDDLWQWHGSVDEAKRWLEKDAKEAQLLFEQTLATLQHTSDCSPDLQDFLTLQMTQLMSKYRMLSAVYLESLLQSAERGEKAQQGAGKGGKTKARNQKAVNQARNTCIRKDAELLQSKGIPPKDIKAVLSRKHNLSSKQITRILANS